MKRQSKTIDHLDYYQKCRKREVSIFPMRIVALPATRVLCSCVCEYAHITLELFSFVDRAKHEIDNRERESDENRIFATYFFPRLFSYVVWIVRVCIWFTRHFGDYGLWLCDICIWKRFHYQFILSIRCALSPNKRDSAGREGKLELHLDSLVNTPWASIVFPFTICSAFVVVGLFFVYSLFFAATAVVVFSKSSVAIELCVCATKCVCLCACMSAFACACLIVSRSTKTLKHRGTEWEHLWHIIQYT